MKKSILLYILLALTLLAILRVWIPWANFSPIGAIALMGGALISHKHLRFILPLGALFIGDLLLSTVNPSYSSYLFSSTFLFVYLAFGLVALVGIALKGRVNLMNVIGGSLLAAVVFFLVTNFGAWVEMPMYSKDFAGLMECYTAAIPFFRNTLISQVLFSVAIYGVYQAYTAKKQVLA